MLCNNHTEITSIEIDNIVESTDMGVQVIITGTGKPLWLPIEHVDFTPGRVIIPAWLARKIWKKSYDKGRETSKRVATLQAM